MHAELLEKRLDKIESMRDEIAAGGDAAQKIRKLPDSIVERLIDEGFFRFNTTLNALGGRRRQ